MEDNNEINKIVDFRIMAPLFKLLKPHIDMLITERLNEIMNNKISTSQAHVPE